MNGLVLIRSIRLIRVSIVKTMPDKILYKELILDLYRNPLNNKELADFDTEKTGHNPSCGDRVVLRLKFDGETISNIGWTGEGCAISMAALSLITDEVKGKTRVEAASITEKQMIEMLGIPISHARMKCALLGWSTIQSAIMSSRPSPKASGEIPS